MMPDERIAEDSHKSPKPPASDGLRLMTKSQRQKSGKRLGRQLDHRDETRLSTMTHHELV
jgi:hypothetical protein